MKITLAVLSCCTVWSWRILKQDGNPWSSFMTVQRHQCTACGSSHGEVFLAVTPYIPIRLFISPCFKSVNIIWTKSFLTGKVLPLKRHAVSLPLNDKCQIFQSCCTPLNPLLQERVKISGQYKLSFCACSYVLLQRFKITHHSRRNYWQLPACFKCDDHGDDHNTRQRFTWKQQVSIDLSTALALSSELKNSSYGKKKKKESKDKQWRLFWSERCFQSSHDRLWLRQLFINLTSRPHPIIDRDRQMAHPITRQVCFQNACSLPNNYQGRLLQQFEPPGYSRVIL